MSAKECRWCADRSADDIDNVGRLSGHGDGHSRSVRGVHVKHAADIERARAAKVGRAGLVVVGRAVARHELCRSRICRRCDARYSDLRLQIIFCGDRSSECGRADI